jgi:periplasmic protein CpxP/Spy
MFLYIGRHLAKRRPPNVLASHMREGRDQMTNDTTPANAAPARSLRTSVLRRGAIAAALLGGGIVIGAAGFATAQGMGPGGWHHGWHGPKIGMIQFFAHAALENVGATSDQETKVHDIIAAAYQKVEPPEGQREEMRKQVLDLLKAPTIDRAAIEKMRAEKVADMDAKSKVIVNAALDAAAQLTPDQRVRLVHNVEARMDEREHGGWGHWGRGFGGPEHGEHGAAEHGPDAGGDRD